MPELAQDEQVTRMTIGITDGKTIIGRGEEGSGTGLWEDDESKSFYENITDLSNLVPAILLGQKSASSGAVDVHPTEDGNNEKNDNYNESVLEEEPKIDEKTEAKAFLSENQEVEETSDKVEVSGAQIAFASLTSKLVNCLSRDAVEQLAIEFIYINNKGTRRQLIQALLGVSRQRLDLLPYYSSLIATLNPYWSEIGTAVVEELESSFHRHQKRKDQIFIEEKLKVFFHIKDLTKVEYSIYW
jgi:regulator of nonsense transcripts 2